MQGCRGVGEAASAALVAEQRLRELGHRHRRIAAVDDHEVGGMTDRDAVVGGIHQTRRQRGDHVEAGAHVVAAAELRDIGIEVRLRMSEQSPNGVNGLSTLLVASEQVTP